MEELYDLFAFRVLVDTVKDCYNVLGVVLLHGAHIVEPVGDLDEDHPDIPAHGEEHLAQILHLLLFHGGVLHPGQLGDPVHDVLEQSVYMRRLRRILGQDEKGAK